MPGYRRCRHSCSGHYLWQRDGGCINGGLSHVRSYDGTTPWLSHRQHETGCQQQVGVDQLRLRMSNSEHQGQDRPKRSDDEDLQYPGHDIIEDRGGNHFFLLFSFRSFRISSSSSGVSFLSSASWMSSGFADPLKTRFKKSCTILPTTSRCG